MPCGAIVIWTSVPVGSVFKLQANGNCNSYDVSAIVSMNGEARPNLEHDQICPGPATIHIDGTRQRWSIRPALITMNPLTNPIVLRASLEDAAGNVVQVPNGMGGTEPAMCEWPSGTTPGSTLELTINVRSVTA